MADADMEFRISAPLTAHVVREGTCSRIRFDVVVPRDVERSMGLEALYALRDALLEHVRRFEAEGVRWAP